MCVSGRFGGEGGGGGVDMGLVFWGQQHARTAKSDGRETIIKKKKLYDCSPDIVLEAYIIYIISNMMI